MIYAVDFDGVLSHAPYPHVGNPNLELFDFLIKRRKHGDKVILWTLREGKLLDLAVNFCKGWGLTFDAVNDNIPEMIERWGCNSRKVSADVYLDDRAVNLTDFLKKYCNKRKGNVRNIRVRG